LFAVHPVATAPGSDSIAGTKWPESTPVVFLLYHK
jgi:hypothetical protein